MPEQYLWYERAAMRCTACKTSSVTDTPTSEDKWTAKDLEKKNYKKK